MVLKVIRSSVSWFFSADGHNVIYPKVLHVCEISTGTYLQLCFQTELSEHAGCTVNQTVYDDVKVRGWLRVSLRSFLSPTQVPNEPDNGAYIILRRLHSSTLPMGRTSSWARRLA